MTKFHMLRQRVLECRPTLLINCAADTDVEGSEADPGRAFSSNAILPGLLAQICHDCKIPIVHFSSTGCYGASKTTPYDEYDELRPTTVHHRAKAAGEDAVRSANPSHLILRLGWMYGGGIGHLRNFVWNRIREGRAKAEIVSDPYQVGVPTWSEDVVKQALVLLDAGLTGTFNCVATGSTTRFDYVQAIMAMAGLTTRLRPQRFIRRAPVSPNEAAENLKLDLMGLNRMQSWDAALGSYIGTLLHEESV